MTSKEFDKKLFEIEKEELLSWLHLESDLPYFLESNVMVVYDRLEKLETFKKLCLTKYVPLDCLSPLFWESKEEWLELMSYDYYLYLCDDVCEYVVKDNKKLTPKEFKLIFELLKEVLGNE